MLVVSTLTKKFCSVSSGLKFLNPLPAVLSQSFFVVEVLQTELGQLSLNDSMTYQPLFEMIEVLILIIEPSFCYLNFFISGQN